jgi:Ca-activated chloride channel family protein
VVCLARPQKGNEETRIWAEGVAIQTLVDVSGSMEALDFNLGGQQVNRLEAIKHVFREFVLGNDDQLPGRPDDLIGLVTFAGYADTKAPLTLDHATVLDILENTHTVMSVDVQKRLWELQRRQQRAQQEGNRARARELGAQVEMVAAEDGTAIGDAIGLAVKNLTELERRRGVGADRSIKSKILVLMTDGANNAGDLSPGQAARMAAAFGYKIYTVGVGTGRRALVPQLDPFGGQVRLVPHRSPIDEETLRTIADATGAKYFRARDTDALYEIYAEIDKLEKTETEEKRYMQFRELATEPIQLGAVTLPPLLMIALGLLVLETLLANTVFRKIP